MPQTDWTDLKAIVVDAAGPVLTAEEEALFRAEKPAGYILFQRNCVSRSQVRELVAAMRACSGRDDIPVLIDQEGGDVSRLKSPEWTEYPAAKTFDRDGGVAAARENAWRMAMDLADLGVTVNCAPVIDVPAPDCHEFLSATRTFSGDPDRVAELGGAVCRGLLDGGVTPILKHIPGHGRARVDSHFALPITDCSLADLSKTDFKPFKILAHSDMKTALWAMTAHVVYSSLDPDSAATVSKRIVDDVIRRDIGFEGVLLADDVSMKALGGELEDRIAATMAAGVDLTMICSAPFGDRLRALAATPRLTAVAASRIIEADKRRKDGRQERKAS